MILSWIVVENVGIVVVFRIVYIVCIVVSLDIVYYISGLYY